jgi:hypothetical protein
MSAVPSSPPATLAWPADVLEFARKEQIDQYLEPLDNALRRLFPTGQFRAVVEPDPELRDVTFLVFEVRVSAKDVPDFLAARRAWHDELHRIVPRTCVVPIVLTLLRVV